MSCATYVRQLGFAFQFEYTVGRAGMKSGRSVRLGVPETRRRSIRLSVESRRYLSFSVSIVNIEVAPDTVNFAAPRQHCWGLKWNAGARRKRYVCDLTKRQERSKCLLTRDVYLPAARETPPRTLHIWQNEIRKSCNVSNYVFVPYVNAKLAKTRSLLN